MSRQYINILLLCLLSLVLVSCDTFRPYHVRAHNALGKPVEIYTGMRHVDSLQPNSIANLPGNTFVREGWGWEWRFSDSPPILVNAKHCGRMVFAHVYSWKDLEKGEIIIPMSSESQDSFIASKETPVEVLSVCELLSSGAFEEALIKLESINTADPLVLNEIEFLKGVIYSQMNDLNSTIETLEPYVRRNPQDIDASLTLIIVYTKKGYQIQAENKEPWHRKRYYYNKRECQNIIRKEFRSANVHYEYKKRYCRAINEVNRTLDNIKGDVTLTRYFEYLRGVLKVNTIYILLR